MSADMVAWTCKLCGWSWTSKAKQPSDFCTCPAARQQRDKDARADQSKKDKERAEIAKTEKVRRDEQSQSDKKKAGRWSRQDSREPEKKGSNGKTTVLDHGAVVVALLGAHY